MSILAIAGSVFLLLGTLICIIGGVGLIRMPDFYTRAHAASIPDTLGAGLALIGMACFTMDLQGPLDYRLLIIVKLISISVLILVTSPIAGHAVAKAAFERRIDISSEALALNINQTCSAAHSEDNLNEQTEIIPESEPSSVEQEETTERYTEQTEEQTEEQSSLEQEEQTEKLEDEKGGEA